MKVVLWKLETLRREETAVDTKDSESMKGQNQAEKSEREREIGTKYKICDLPRNVSPHHVTCSSFCTPYIQIRSLIHGSTI
jgi:hypothetical protein